MVGHGSEACLIGYLVTPEKARKHVGPGLIHRAEKAGVKIVVIDPARPIADQGHFAAIVQKAVGDARREELLRDFQRAHPNVPIIDPIERVLPLHDRSTMLKALSNGITILAPHDEASVNSIAVSAPPQVTLPSGVSMSDAISAIEDAGVQLPMVAKPLRTGRPDSHELALIRDLEGLQSLVFETEESRVRLPAVLQQYIPHGGILTKVFAIGAATVMAQRGSLDAAQLRGSGIINVCRVSKFPDTATRPDAGGAESAAGGAAPSDMEFGSLEGSAVPAGRIEIAAEHTAASAAEAAEDAAHAARDAAAAAEPPEWFIRGLTRELQHELGLQLFNYDLLSPAPGAAAGSDASGYHVIDINFFPGYEKLPDYEDLMTQFLTAVVHGEKTGAGFGPDSFHACTQLS